MIPVSCLSVQPLLFLICFNAFLFSAQFLAQEKIYLFLPRSFRSTGKRSFLDRQGGSDLFFLPALQAQPENMDWNLDGSDEQSHGHEKQDEHPHTATGNKEA